MSNEKGEISLKYFFPVQLLIGYFKRDYLFIFSWLLLFGIITGQIGKTFGLQYVMLAPIYMDKISWLAFVFSGFGLGSFIVAFNLSAYVVFAHRYPFLATVSRPFLVFSLNNSILPLTYIIVYIFASLKHQIYYELIPWNIAVLNILVFLLGLLTFVGISFLYFYITSYFLPNKLKFKFNKEAFKKKKIFSWLIKRYDYNKAKKIQQAPKTNTGADKIDWYIGKNFKLLLSRDFSHYDSKFLSKTFTKQHIHAFIFAILMFLLIFVRGLMNNRPVYIIPASASLYVIFTETMLVVTLFYVIFAEWSLFAFFVIVLAINFLFSSLTERYTYTAYGLNYHIKSKVNILAQGNTTQDSLEIIKILNIWKNKYETKYHHKPKFVIITASGGGMKQTLWAYYVTSYIDSLSNGQLMQSTRLMTGASGGMVGLAYVREFYRQQITGQIKDFHNKKYLENLTKDALNPIIFSLSMSDMFPQYITFRHKKHYYVVDRAYMFEQAFNLHTGYALEKTLGFYRKYEQNASIPFLIITPSIMNVGTRLIISPLGMSFLTQHKIKINTKNIEFRRVYKKFDADSLNFLTAIRMNASFPYVSPYVTLPGKPRIRIMDAGLNDNYGFVTAADFLITFKKWLEKNTSGIVMINLFENEIFNYNDKINNLHKFFEPFFSLMNDWDIIQNTNYHDFIYALQKTFTNKFYIFDITYGNKKNLVSLSWHLTKREKNYLYQQIYSPGNQRAINKILFLLNEN